MGFPEMLHSGLGLSSTSKSQDERKTRLRKSRKPQMPTEISMENCNVKIVTEMKKCNVQNMASGGGKMNQRNIRPRSIISQYSEKTAGADNEESTDSDSESNYSQDSSTTTDEAQSTECGDDGPSEKSAWQGDFAIAECSTPCSTQGSSPVLPLAAAALQGTQLTSWLADSANAVLPAEESDCNKAIVAAKRRMADVIASDENRGTKRAKTQETDAAISELEDYQKNVELETVRAEDVLIYSVKPDELMMKAEFEVNRGDKKAARAALTKALNRLRCHSKVSAESFCELAKVCEKNRNYFRACVFLMFSAYRHVAETVHRKDLPTRIYEIGSLVRAMLKESEQDPDFSPGVYWKDVAKFVVSFMPRVYGKGFGKDELELPCDKAYALSWIAIAYRDVKQHKQAAKHAEKGIRIMDLEFRTEAERHGKQTYARLLRSLGAAHAMKKGKEVVAQKLLQEAVAAAHEVADYANEKKRQDAIKYTIIDLENVEKKIRAMEQRDERLKLSNVVADD